MFVSVACLPYPNAATFVRMDASVYARGSTPSSCPSSNVVHGSGSVMLGSHQPALDCTWLLYPTAGVCMAV
jgi:hypothetical protein